MTTSAHAAAAEPTLTDPALVPRTEPEADSRTLSLPATALPYPASAPPTMVSS